jgi:hypothetical protein
MHYICVKDKYSVAAEQRYSINLNYIPQINGVFHSSVSLLIFDGAVLSLIERERRRG